MSPVSNPAILFNSIPKGEPTEENFKYDTSQTIDLDQDLKGGLIIKLLCCSVDPYMRGRMRPAETKSYSPAFELGKPFNGHAVAVVVKSEDSGFPVGTHVYGVFPYQAYLYFPKQKSEPDAFLGGAPLTILHNKENLPWSAYIGAAGMPGRTAYMAWKEISEAKAGETAFVSAGAGPVGSLVIQIAKQQGLTVITSAGSKDKVEYCKSLGADIAFNYKEEDANEVFSKYGKGIDVNWVNVGGEAFENELNHMNVNGRIIACGWISGYNGQSHGVRNMMQFIAKRLKMQGFIVSDFEKKYGKEFMETIPKALADGTLKFAEAHYDGLENWPKAFTDMLSGRQVGLGKVVVNIARD